VQSPSYRAILQRQADLITAKAGEAKAAAIKTKHIRSDVTGASNPSARLKAWRFWGGDCPQTGLIENDPRRAVRLNATPTKGHTQWTREDIEAFRAAYPIGSTPRAIMEVCFWTGARISDAVAIGPQHIGKDGILSFRQKKTKAPAFIPWNGTLPEFARGMEADRDHCIAAINPMQGGLTFLQARQGRARSEKAAGHVVSKACKDIGLPLSCHGLRKARAAVLAGNGATTHEIAAWTGHTSLKEVERYTAQMSRRGLVSSLPVGNQVTKSGN